MNCVFPKCKLCGGDVLPPRRSYCSDACTHEWKKRSKRIDAPRSSPGGKLYIPHNCSDCGQKYIGHIKTKRCPDCQKTANLRASAECKRRKALGNTRKLGSMDLCENCGKPYVVNGGKQRYCKDCADKAVLENIRRYKRDWNREYYSNAEMREIKNSKRRKDWKVDRACAICGSIFIPDSPNQKFCSDACRTINRRNLQRIADKKRSTKE